MFLPLKAFCLDALTYAGNYNNIKSLEDKPNFKFVKGNITDINKIRELLGKSGDPQEGEKIICLKNLQ